MMSEKMQKALNDQIAAEMYASNLYLAMSAYFQSINLPGFAAWMLAQSREETGHAMRIFNHVVERGDRVTLQKIDAPQAEWASPLAVFEAAYGHERKVTGMINNLAAMADAETDRPTAIFLQWFINEQVEEEASTDEVVQKLKMIGDSPNGLLMLDHKLGERQGG